MATADDKEMIDRVEEVVSAKEEDDVEFVTSSGVHVRGLAIPPHVIQRLWEAYPEVKPPTIPHTDGDLSWNEPNFDDPEYIAADEQRVIKLAEAFRKLYILKGMEILRLPEGMPTFNEDKEWLEEYSELGLSTDFPTRSSRYIEWVHYRVLPLERDMEKLQNIATKIMSVSEEDVESAESRFQHES